MNWGGPASPPRFSDKAAAFGAQLLRSTPGGGVPKNAVRLTSGGGGQCGLRPFGGVIHLNGQRLTETEIAIVKRARSLGYVNHEIAAYFGVNQGRVAEINRGKVGGHVSPAIDLPADFPTPIRRAKILYHESLSQADLFTA